MIRHVVFFSAKQPENLIAIEEGLAVLANNPHVRHLEVGRNLKADKFSSEIDVVVYGEFDNEAALTAFKAHPIWQEATDRVKPLREIRTVADWSTKSARGSQHAK